MEYDLDEDAAWTPEGEVGRWVPSSGLYPHFNVANLWARRKMADGKFAYGFNGHWTHPEASFRGGPIDWFIPDPQPKESLRETALRLRTVPKVRRKLR